MSVRARRFRVDGSRDKWMSGSPAASRCMMLGTWEAPPLVRARHSGTRINRPPSPGLRATILTQMLEADGLLMAC